MALIFRQPACLHIWLCLSCVCQGQPIFLCLNNQAYNWLIQLQSQSVYSTYLNTTQNSADSTVRNRTGILAWTKALQFVAVRWWLAIKYWGQSSTNIGRSVSIAVGYCQVTSGNEVLAWGVDLLVSGSGTPITQLHVLTSAELSQTQKNKNEKRKYRKMNIQIRKNIK